MSILNITDEASDWMNYDGVEGVGQGEKDGKEGFEVVIRETGIPSSQ